MYCIHVCSTVPTITAAYLRTLPSFSNILMRSFLGGCGMRVIQDCLLSSRDPKPL